MTAPDPAPGAPATRRWCERCGTAIPADAPAGADRCAPCAALPEDEELDEAPARAPWHFKVLVVGTIGYLIYRLIWFIGWISHHA